MIYDIAYKTPYGARLLQNIFDKAVAYVGKYGRVKDLALLDSDKKCERSCTSNHMLWRTIWDKLSECIFKKFENARVKREQFQNFQKSRGRFILKIAEPNT